MDIATVMKLAIVLSIALIVFSIGLNSTFGTGVRFVRSDPGLAARAMLSMFLAMPLFVLFITWLLPLEPPVRVALLALSVSPMPPILPRKDKKVGGSDEFIAGTLLLAPLVSMVVIPLFIWLAERVFGGNVDYEPVTVFKTLLVTLGIPLLAGMLVRRFMPDLAARIQRPVGLAGTALLAVLAIALLAFTFPFIRKAIGNGAVLAMVAVVAFGLVAGHLLGGPIPGNRRALAVTTASRHPGVAIGVASLPFPQETQSIVGAVLLYLLLNALVTIPYLRWQRGKQTA